ncbi:MULTISPECIES: cache domain-containing sensor histidine kinase [Paenibacillus]|uniref:histidine kinase n=1 Tax=Paenibacillus campinasensis TaxID=66347 RepID=A0A268ELJ5_9BACL|nr:MULTISPECIES: sensor histidine kinase [Paenibacillus]MUG67725.1 HAMP domain-containing protein [Paenibacillus campinasensis]PAD73992.1 sensor histidine kinase [Paenibacillus campinasensis]PAK48845.1 sensor histidine kinase [Paenibacillus sp. 7541]
MNRLGRFGSFNTLRNQIFLGFMLVMVIVLALVGFFVYNQVSVLLQNSAERHIQQTAVQAAGKLDASLKQVDTLSAQVSTNATVQRFLTQETEGQPISFSERQSLQQEVRKYEAYATGIRSMEIYTTDYRRLFPLDEGSLESRVPGEWIALADSGQGRLYWFGQDPKEPDLVIALRRIRLIDESFAHGGYLLVRMEKSYFDLTDTSAASDIREAMLLYDQAGHMIASNFHEDVDPAYILEREGETLTLGKEDYISVHKQSAATGWRIVMLTPVDYTTEGISVLRTSILVSGAVGALLFLVFSFILTTMITRPILQLIKAMRGARFGTLKPNKATSSTMEINELNNTYNQMVDSLNELIEVVYQKEIIQSRTELKALQAQINPHFLFNTLEAFYWALEEKGEEELAQVVVAMSGLFRYVINRKDEDEWVTIADELEHAERYLTIMKMRLLDRISWRIEADDRCRKIMIPKLLIQPLVENAILHGVEQKLEPGKVVLRVEPSAQPGYTRISVSDDGPGMDEEALAQLYEAMERGHSESSKGSGVGLANVGRRIGLYYSAEQGGLNALQVESRKGSGTTVSFEIPNDGKGEIR